MSPRSGICEHWRALRERGRLGTLLPPCVDRSWGEGAGAAGFVTLDYRVYRDLLLPSGSHEPTATRADLVEMYWSVRTKSGRQDPTWAAALNAHVIQVLDEPVSPSHFEDLYQMVVSLRRALHVGAIGPLVATGKPLALHVRGLLLGPSLSAPAEIVDRLATHADVPLTVGCYDTRADGDLEFRAASSQPGRWETSTLSEEELASLGRRLVQQDQLFRSQGEWIADPGYEWDDEGNPRPPRSSSRFRSG